MTHIHSAFSKSYAEARQKFLGAAQAAGLQVESHVHPEKGRDGEELAMDVVREGPVNDMLIALRADHWLHIHPEASDELKQSIKAQIFAAFYTDTDVWRDQIISQAREAMFQAVEGLK